MLRQHHILILNLQMLALIKLAKKLPPNYFNPLKNFLRSSIIRKHFFGFLSSVLLDYKEWWLAGVFSVYIVYGSLVCFWFKKNVHLVVTDFLRGWSYSSMDLVLRRWPGSGSSLEIDFWRSMPGRQAEVKTPIPLQNSNKLWANFSGASRRTSPTPSIFSSEVFDLFMKEYMVCTLWTCEARLPVTSRVSKVKFFSRTLEITFRFMKAST